ncbi:voltage-gated potassium channel protein [Serratia oryzae]|uniref:Voltage-gated potassium channel TrkA n=1 Tax=Serratia oryzae TaxID=2034155 RepID=A0A1S8CKS8_9GAMM|nr:voltage-gated potassium channel protein [Serratia oryzae]OMQ23825.1 voltage-gated potassium channel TrkA [Serratia oryzae]
MKILKKIERLTPVTFIIALMVAHNGYLILSPIFWKLWQHSHDLLNSFTSWHETIGFLDTMDIPRLMIGIVLIFMAVILLWRARIAWFFSLILFSCIIVVDIFIFKQVTALVWYSFITVVALMIFWRRFDHHSLGSTSFFALASMASLIVYSMLGTLYLGEQFTPKITDLPTAFYFAIVCMSTVGFGDIIPHTTLARMFTLTVIIFGITIFATSVASIAGTLISQNLQYIMKGRFSHMARKNHYIIVGASALAQNVHKGLTENGGKVTIVCEQGHKQLFPDYTDVVEGDPSSVATLTLAGAEKAKYIVALTESDAVNAFVILAAKEVGGKETKTITLVNESQNMSKIKRVKPDAVLSLQLLGSELLVRSLNGEVINRDLNLDTFFSHEQEGNKSP